MKGQETKQFAFGDNTAVPRSEEFNPHLHELGIDMSEVDQTDLFNGLQLRMLRRSRGLNQTQLAELLGVTQPNVSRWEAGFERTPARLQGKLKDILTGHNGHAGEYFYRVAHSDPSLTAHEIKQFSLPIVKLSEGAASMLSKKPADYIGKDFRRVFKTDWLDDLFQSRPLTDFALVHLNHDLIPEEENPRIRAKRVDTLLYIFRPEDGVPLMLAHAHFSAPTGEPARIVHAISLEDMISPT